MVTLIDPSPTVSGMATTPFPLPDLHLDTSLGALYIGNLVVAILYGITCIQMYTYYLRSGEDGLRLKGIIFILWAIDSFHLALISHEVYYYAVTNYANPLALVKATWSTIALVPVVSINDNIVRSMFAYRIWRLSGRNKPLTAAIVIASLITLGTAIAIAVKSAHYMYFADIVKISGLVYLVLSAVVIADVLVAVSLCVLLSRQKTVFARTKNLIRILMMYTINTGTLTSVCAIASLVTYTTMPSTDVYLAIYNVLPKLYFNALLATLNSRAALRETFAGTQVSIPLSRLATSHRVNTIVGNKQVLETTGNRRAEASVPDSLFDVEVAAKNTRSTSPTQNDSWFSNNAVLDIGSATKFSDDKFT